MTFKRGAFQLFSLEAISSSLTFVLIWFVSALMVTMSPSAPHTRSPCVSEGIIRTEEALCPSRSRNTCVLVWPSKRNGNRRKPSLTFQDGDWTTHLGFRHYVACFQSYCCIFDNLKSGDLAREGVRSDLPTINPCEACRVYVSHWQRTAFCQNLTRMLTTTIASVCDQGHVAKVRTHEDCARL